MQDNYTLMSCGGSVGDGYGPMIVSPQASHGRDQRRSDRRPRQANHGLSRAQALRPGIETAVVPFDKIIPQRPARRVRSRTDHSRRPTHLRKDGLHEAVDLGKWWREQTGLPLPWAAMRFAASLGRRNDCQHHKALRDSIQYALDHREEALSYAMQFARDLDPQLADRFVGMYVNERTLDYGNDGREAMRRLLDMGHKAGIIPQTPRVEWV